VQPSRPLAARTRHRATPATAAAGRASGNASTARNTSGGAARESLVSDGAIKSLSPEARRIFREVRPPARVCAGGRWRLRRCG
jgi:hypothetical protein